MPEKTAKRGRGRPPAPEGREMFASKLAPGLLAQFRAAAAALGRPFSDCLTEAMQAWLKRKAPK